jgi:formamidopyrimidine-DNA glycosylase
MPELPEVETVRRGLQERALGERIVSVQVRHPGILEDVDAATLDRIVGSEIARLERIGKYLLVRLESEAARRTLVVHLGMTGQLRFQSAAEPTVDGFVRLASGYRKTKGAHAVDAYTHLLVDCASGGRFLFRDPRRFGRILLLEGWGLLGHPRLDKLGPDAIALSAPEMARRLSLRGGARAVKAVLLDQSVVAGVGNIYADESCFSAGIRPSARFDRLSRPRILRLSESVLEALERGIRNCGTSFRDFVGADGEAGTNAEDLRVYGRGGKPCLRCGNPLRSAVVAGRGTVYCACCQR